jgi:hypothetical protein
MAVSTTKVSLDNQKAKLVDLEAGDTVVVQSKAAKGATSFTANIVNALSPLEQPYYLDVDSDGIGAEGPVQYAPNRVPEGYVSNAGPDNCAEVANPFQADTDVDGIGDACEDSALQIEDPRSITYPAGAT